MLSNGNTTKTTTTSRIISSKPSSSLELGLAREGEGEREREGGREMERGREARLLVKFLYVPFFLLLLSPLRPAKNLSLIVRSAFFVLPSRAAPRTA